MARLVAIGDSLTQGFASLAVSQVDLSYPAMIARSLGLGAAEFPVPDFRGSGGLPLNLEWLARELQRRHGAFLDGFDWITSVFDVASLLDTVEDYWERGPGSRPLAPRDYHNLAVWGFEVGDAFALTAGLAASFVGKPRDALVGIPSEARMRTALRVLNPALDPARTGATQLSVARGIAADEGIDHLVVWLGANNCLGTVLQLKVKETGKAPPGPRSDFTLWHADAFKADYRALAAQVAKVGAKHVYVATVPHVTIPPVTRGIMKSRGTLPPGRKYYDYYTYFFVHDKAFDPDDHPHLTGADARYIDERIDQYNDTIRAEAAARGWTVVDTCDILDRLAVRRNHGNPTFPLPAPIADLSVRFFEIQPSGALKNGGLISLDGVHPTVCGYGLVAQAFVDAIRVHEPKIRDIDFAALRRLDTLVSRPPRTLDDIMGMLRCLQQHFDFLSWYR